MWLYLIPREAGRYGVAGFPGGKGNQFSKNAYVLCPVYTSVVVLRCVFAAAWASLEGLREAAF